MTTETKIREAFEAWITDFSDGEASIEMNGDEYADYATNCMWEGYKAAMASMSTSYYEREINGKIIYGWGGFGPFAKEKK